MRRRFTRSAVALAIMAGTVGVPAAAERKLQLLFVDRSGCSWCARFEQETLPAYVASDVGRSVPLMRANLDNGQPRNVQLDEPIRFTPTFVLLIDGREVSRIVGYRDNATFFGLVEKQIADRAGKPGEKK